MLYFLVNLSFLVFRTIIKDSFQKDETRINRSIEYQAHRECQIAVWSTTHEAATQHERPARRYLPIYLTRLTNTASTDRARSLDQKYVDKSEKGETRRRAPCISEIVDGEGRRKEEKNEGKTQNTAFHIIVSFICLQHKQFNKYT